jgi:HAE1 family hydrophobic/amphiphilic exporter-1
VEEIMKELEEKSKEISGATIEFFQPPAVPGYGAAGGFELRLLDKAGSGDFKKMETVSKDFVKELSKRPELILGIHLLQCRLPSIYAKGG